MQHSILKYIQKALLFILGLTMVSCITFRETTEVFMSLYEEGNRVPEIYEDRVAAHKVRYAEIGDDSSTVILFVHGAPGSFSGSAKPFFLDSVLQANTRLITYDRPGYGFNESYGKPEVSIRNQAKAIRPILKRYPDSKIIVVGSSYGGPIAAKMAMNHPDRITGLILVSAAVAPGEERIYGVSYPARRKAFNWIMPRSLHVANEEKHNHEKELVKMLPYWERIIAPTTIIHGLADRLIYPPNASFADSMIVNAPTQMRLLEGVGHAIIWEHPNFITDAIYHHMGLSVPELQFTEDIASPPVPRQTQTELLEVQSAMHEENELLIDK
ncbi:MAG: alpha/beta hydrolase [Cyclobacteriaceae bacterium]|nr:alpha/beta hydrolase [Cyclobacteriaceae bacterium]MCH8516061.1 alpha/beta hydrolase [Cyclobacteriaceae bacterium]